MSKKNIFTHTLIWFKRFRKRKGYGVHSPFAFNFITRVIYQKGYYYNYNLFHRLPEGKIESIKICKLLFRIVNYGQPQEVYYSSVGADISNVFKWAKSDTHVVREWSEAIKYDFLYIVPTKGGEIKEDISTIIEQITDKSILVLYGICYSKKCNDYWVQLIKHPKAGISFDLYDLGVLFFDKSKNKQDYIVNF